MFCDKNAAAKSACIQKAKVTLEFAFTEIQDGGEEHRCKKKGGNHLKMLASYYYCPRSCSLSALASISLQRQHYLVEIFFLRCTVVSPEDRNRYSLEVNGTWGVWTLHSILAAFPNRNISVLTHLIFVYGKKKTSRRQTLYINSFI